MHYTSYFSIISWRVPSLDDFPHLVFHVLFLLCMYIVLYQSSILPIVLLNTDCKFSKIKKKVLFHLTQRQTRQLIPSFPKHKIYII